MIKLQEISILAFRFFVMNFFFLCQIFQFMLYLMLVDIFKNDKNTQNVFHLIFFWISAIRLPSITLDNFFDERIICDTFSSLIPKRTLPRTVENNLIKFIFFSRSRFIGNLLKII
jgi:hypothetical protein